MATPSSRRRILILGGTTESATLAEALHRRADIEVITSLAGRTQAPRSLPGLVRSGGFGGVDGLHAYLLREAIDLIIDATHPFATEISRNACAAAARTRISLLRLDRPAWAPRSGDRWDEVDDLHDAAAAAANHARVFLTVGANELTPFAGLSSTWFLVRLIDRPPKPLPLASHAVVTGRGPFATDAEMRLLRQHRIGAVVAKNSGGDATYGKIAAARELGLPVIMVRRPSPAPSFGAAVTNTEDALAWVEDQLVAG
jgi:precorrin-6A/cobalt-precorrin-6A reductase